MTRPRRVALALLASTLVTLWSACGGGGGGDQTSGGGGGTPITITTTSLPDGTRTFPYDASISATGGNGTKTWSITSGALPDGLSLASTTGRITGTPTVAGMFSFTVQVSASGGNSTSRGLSITIDQPSISVEPQFLPSGIIGISYNAALQASGGNGGPFTFSLASGALPAGISLASDGVFSGTPTTAGSFKFTVEVTDGEQVASGSYTVGVSAPLSITTTTLPDGKENTDYNTQLQASGGLSSLTWTLVLGALPNGIVLSGNNLLGRPTQRGTYDFTVRVEDQSRPSPQTDTQALTIVVQPGPLDILTATLPAAKVGAAYSATLEASGGTAPYTWIVSFGSLPPGLSLSGSGTISGTPTTEGNFIFNVRVTDNVGAMVTKTRSILVLPVGRNDTIASATALSNGTFRASISPYETNGVPDQDFYRIVANAGATVTIEICANRGSTPDCPSLLVASPLDPVIEIVDANETRFQTCNDPVDDSPLTDDNGNVLISQDTTPNGFDDPCMNDDIELAVTRDSRLQFRVPGNSGAMEFYVRVIDWSGNARPDMAYDIIVSGAN